MADRVVGEREERLREIIENLRFNADGQEQIAEKSKGDSARHLRLTYLSNLRGWADRLEALASSPSPPDRDLSSEGDERFRVFALMMYDHGCAAPETCTQDVPCGPCAAADALGEPRWVQK